MLFEEGQIELITIVLNNLERWKRIVIGQYLETNPRFPDLSIGVIEPRLREEGNIPVS